MEFREVLQFWFEDIKPEQWWTKDDDFDLQVKERFGELHKSATLGELDDWRSSARGRLAEILVLDQFSRNIYRNDSRSFAWDSTALALAQEAIRKGSDQELSSPKKAFLYMPYMHSESVKIHRQALELYSVSGLEFSLDFEIQHKEIIDRFGRYPHRNAILGRESTPEEIAYLEKEGVAF